MTANEVLEEVELRMMKSVDLVKDEFSSIQTGKASPALVENIMVDYYGTATRLRDLAGIATPEPRLLVIQPWDPTALGEVEKAIQKANIGLNPINDGKIIRIPIPEMSEERRRDLVKVIKKVAEEGKVAIRNIRRDGNHQAEELEKSSSLSEDEKFLLLKEIQEKTDDYIHQLDQLLAKKEEEILEI